MATTDNKDKKIGEVPHLENVTGKEKIPVSADGEPRYIEVEQIGSVGIVSVSGTELKAEIGRYYRFDEGVNTLNVTLPNVRIFQNLAH